MKNNGSIKKQSENTFIGASAIVGDQNVLSAYNKLMQEKFKIYAKMDKYFLGKDYGTGLELILYMFYVEGEHHWFKMPDEIKLGRYSAKEKSISVNIPMPKSTSAVIIAGDLKKTEEFLMDTYKKSGELIASSKSLVKIDFNAKKFAQDYQVFLDNLLAMRTKLLNHEMTQLASCGNAPTTHPPAAPVRRFWGWRSPSLISSKKIAARASQ